MLLFLDEAGVTKRASRPAAARLHMVAVKKLSRAVTTLPDRSPKEKRLSLMNQAELGQSSVPCVLLVYDGTASAQQSLLHSEALSRWPEAVFILVAALQGSPAGSDQDGLVDFFPEAAAAERAHVRFVLERGADALRDGGFRVDAMVVEGACVDELVRIARTEAAALVAVAHRPEAPWSRQWWQTHVVRGLIDRLPCGLLLLAVR